jgi:hypothetical protein
LTGVTGGQASIAAFNSLYSGCTAPVPAADWAYNTGGQILTSPIFSRDGKQIAFAQTAGGVGFLVVLKWLASNGTVAASVLPTLETPATYLGCTAPCMTTIPLQDGSLIPTNDTTSSVFYNYGADIAWVGDSKGWLHQFTGVFLGTPTEVRTVVAPIWPAQMNSGGAVPLASPVYDHGSGSVFVGDQGGFFYQVNATTAAVTQSGRLGTGTGIVAGPIVDSSAGVAYVFASNNGSGAAAVYQFKPGFSAASTGASVTVGTSSSTQPLYEGAPDSAYESSGATGNLYVCGNPGGAPTLYQVPITAGVLGTAVTGPVLTSATTGCSPVTDILNPNAVLTSAGPADPEEYIFAGVQNSGTPTNCATAGCLVNFRATPWKALHAYALGQEILDSHFQVQMVSVAGTSGSSAPSWNTTAGGTTSDGATLRWLNLAGVTTSVTPAVWVKNTVYAVNDVIADSNGNTEVVTAVNGTHRSGNTPPGWATTVGGSTTDRQVTWVNAGPAQAARASAGGTSAVIVDNTVGSSTQVGASQVYFQTQSNQTCTPPVTGGTGGCAIQTSQPGLN